MFPEGPQKFRIPYMHDHSGNKRIEHDNDVPFCIQLVGEQQI